jgi:hypothetical protein
MAPVQSSLETQPALVAPGEQVFKVGLQVEMVGAPVRVWMGQPLMISPLPVQILMYEQLPAVHSQGLLVAQSQ